MARSTYGDSWFQPLLGVIGLEQQTSLLRPETVKGGDDVLEEHARLACHRRMNLELLV